MSIRRWWYYRAALKRRRTRRDDAKHRLASERWSVLTLVQRAIAEGNSRDVVKYGRRLRSIDVQHGCPILKGSSVQIGHLVDEMAELPL